ncbi:hypothetical protein MNBD_BACTEROID03-1523 [hydrothermal vent metagenome]|uniref:Uncharacterized protein n=1 Tax=hydrothermal vent metagenome TaxID=652676 RepID=A0A3B0SXB6_9ZZZZ
MKYEVFIDGGFMGFPKTYQGEVFLEDDIKRAVFKGMKIKIKPTNDLRDGFQYHLKFIDNNIEYTAIFDELNLPLQVRRFIDSVRKK